MQETAAEYFDDLAASYDSLIRRAVPRYEEMSERLVAYLPDGVSRVLELGCGTGNLTLRLARRYPSAAITAVDAAPEMVELTRSRVAADAGRTAFAVARFEEFDAGPGSYDVVTSCISLHHVRDKAALYRRVHRWLRPGGAFRFADQLRGGTDAIHSLNWSRWLEFCRQPGHCTEEEVRSLLDHAAAHDHYTPLHEHFRLLADAGFPGDRLDCVWRNWIWGIVVADRPA